MGTAFVKSEKGRALNATTGTTAAISTGDGNAILIGINTFYTRTFVNVTDTNSNTKTAAQADVDSGAGNNRCLIWSLLDQDANANYQATGTLNDVGYLGITVEEVSGIAAADALDDTGSGTGEATATASAHPTVTGDYAFGIGGQSQSVAWSISGTPTPTLTQDQNTRVDETTAADVISGYNEDISGTTEQVITITATGATTCCVAIATYKAGEAPPADVLMAQCAF